MIVVIEQWSSTGVFVVISTFKTLSSWSLCIYFQVKAVRYWPSPQDPDEVLERMFETYDSNIYVKFLSQRDETDYIIRELEVWKINKDGKVGFVY